MTTFTATGLGEPKMTTQGSPSFAGLEPECLELIQRLNAELGYPRTYTQDDIDSGLVVQHGKGPHVPIEQVYTATVAEPQDDEAKQGGLKVVHLPEALSETCQDIVVEHKVLRVLNHSTKDELMALPGIGSVRADAIIAIRDKEPIRSLDDAKLSASVLDGIKDHTKVTTLESIKDTSIKQEDLLL